MTEHLLVIADTHLVEFLGIIGVYGQELDSFVKGKGFVHGFLEHPEIKRQPADIPVDVFVLAHMERYIYKCSDSLQYVRYSEAHTCPIIGGIPVGSMPDFSILVENTLTWIYYLIPQ
jgi:hypothetical protein